MHRKKFLLSIVILLIALFSNLSLISAESTTCEYNFAKDGDIKIIFSGSGKPEVSADLFSVFETPREIKNIFKGKNSEIDSTANDNLDKYFSLYNKDLISNKDIETQLDDIIGFCPQKIYVCVYEEFKIGNSISDIVNIVKQLSTGESHPTGFGANIYISYSENGFNSDVRKRLNFENGKWVAGSSWIPNVVECINSKNSGSEVADALACVGEAWLNFNAKSALSKLFNYSDNNFFLKRKNCKSIEYTGSNKTYNMACSNTRSYYNDLTNTLDEYNKCDNSTCKVEKLSEANKIENTIKNYCSQLINTYDYSDSAQRDCLDECFNVGNSIIKIKKDYGLISNNSSNCGFSAKLVSWIQNIMRWIKYILPVIVIITGIFDFIKAMASEKDDEMKKTQSKFIKRLIAAALTFIVPLILEFILEKMGFSAESCGLF